MKLLIQNNTIIGYAGDDYTGPEQFIVPPQHVTEANFNNYTVKDGVVVLDLESVPSKLTQQKLDNFAKQRGYDSMLSLCNYTSSTNPVFKAEAQYGVELRDQTWAKLYEFMSEVKASTRPAPQRFEDIESQLPELNWDNLTQPQA